MSFRIAHITDIHWMVEPSLWRVWWSKRALGTANLYLGGRRHHFREDVQAALVAEVVAQQPDLVILTGDLTAQALPAEFEKARAALDPILRAFPTFIIPGNHDTYTTGAFRSRRIERYFGEWMGLEPHRPVGRLDIGPVTVLGLDPNRPSWSASGEVPAEQLTQLGQLLQEDALRERFLVLALHYPILGPGGALYENRGHGLLNAGALVKTLEQAPIRPHLAIHGHKHHGYRGQIRFSDGHHLETHNPGSGGYQLHTEAGRAAAFNTYTIEAGRLAHVQRYLYDGTGFPKEVGEIYSSGY
jgi:3',5'-cyclic AMP phosphodiesterase CpdA